MRRTALRLTLVVYVALLVAPAATLLPGPTWTLFAAGTVPGAIAGAVVTRKGDAAAWLSTVPRGVAGLLAALLWVVPAAASGAILTPWTVGVLAALPWLVALSTASHCRMQDRIEAATTLVTFEARPPRSQRRQMTVAATALVAFGIAVGVAFVLFTGGVENLATLAWLPGMLSVFVVVLSNRQEREVTITDAGITVQNHLQGWDSIEGFEVTEEAVVFSRSDWYRSSFRFDRDDIDDTDAVEAALNEQLR
jgi:hypothetical protein